MIKTTRKSIPWAMKSSALLNSWKWETPHFEVVILAEGIGEKKMYSWKIYDKSNGQPSLFETNVVADFAFAVDEVLEVIGKAYDRALGYQEYAGSLATTFKIFDNRTIDFARAIGRTVTVKIRNNDDAADDIILSGQLDVEHYDILLYSGEDAVTRIPPNYIKYLSEEFSQLDMLGMLEVTKTPSKTGRMVDGPWVKGCTGKPNILNTKVMHSPNSGYCPIHGI